MKKRRKSGSLTPGESATFAGSGVETNEVLEARRRFVFALWSVYRDCVKKLDSRAFGAYGRFVKVADRYLDDAWHLRPWSALNAIELLGNKPPESIDSSIPREEVCDAIDCLKFLRGGQQEVIDAPQLSSEELHKAITALQAPGGKLRTAILGWAQEHHADKEVWMLDGALRVMSSWKSSSKWRRDHVINGFTQGVGGVVATGHEFVFKHTGWNPQVEMWGDYHNDVRTALKMALSEYQGQVRDGLEKRKAKSSRKEHMHTHFEWFALYQLKGLSHHEIVDQYESDESGLWVDLDASAVRKGVNTAVGLLDWNNLRKLPRGRPKKQAS